MKENGFTLKKARSRRYPGQTIMDTDYADDIALLANTPTQTLFLLHSLELEFASKRMQAKRSTCVDSKKRHRYSKWWFSEISK